FGKPQLLAVGAVADVLRGSTIRARPHEPSGELHEDQMDRKVRLAGKRQPDVLLEALESTDFRPAPYHPRAEIAQLQIAREFCGVRGEAVAVVVHLLAKQPHRLTMLMPGDGARLVNERPAVADGAGHDVQIAPAARHAANIESFV